MIRRMLFSRLSRWQLLIVFFGALVGLLFLLTVIHYLGVVRNMNSGEDALGTNLVIAQKRVTKYSTFNEKSTVITSAEFEALKNHEAVASIEPVLNNQFNVSLAMREEGLPYFSTDIFIQSVANDILDIRLESWHWEEGDDFVPLVMPRDFMLMLNQFASAYKMPAISEEIAKTLNFKLELRSKGGRKSFDSRIIGFSNQMNGVLVPTGFMNYGNTHFSDNVSQDITQVVIVMNERKYSDFEQLMDDLNLDIKENELLVIKVQAVLFVVLSFLLLIALVIIFLSAMMIIQFSLLVLANSQYEIQTLLRLGYHPDDLARHFYSYFLRLLVFVVLTMLPVFILLKTVLDKNIQNFGFPISFWPSGVGLATVVLLCWAMVHFNFVRVRSNIIKQC